MRVPHINEFVLDNQYVIVRIKRILEIDNGFFSVYSDCREISEYEIVDNIIEQLVEFRIQSKYIIPNRKLKIQLKLPNGKMVLLLSRSVSIYIKCISTSEIGDKFTKVGSITRQTKNRFTSELAILKYKREVIEKMSSICLSFDRRLK